MIIFPPFYGNRRSDLLWSNGPERSYYCKTGFRSGRLIVTSYPYVYGHELIDDCIEKLKDYSEDSIPVLNNNNKLLGVITSQSIVDLVDDEMGEDYAKFCRSDC